MSLEFGIGTYLHYTLSSVSQVSRVSRWLQGATKRILSRISGNVYG